MNINVDFSQWNYELSKSEADERRIHRELREHKPHLVTNMYIGNKEKKEIYVFDEYIYKDFVQLKEYLLNHVSNTKIDEFVQLSIKEQYNYFLKLIKDNMNSSFHSMISSIPNMTDLHVDVIKHHINKNHEEIIFERQLMDKQKEREHQLKLFEVKAEHEKVIYEFELDKLSKQIELERTKRK